MDRTCADISKAQRLLGYRPKVSFAEGIANMVSWYVEAVEAGLISGEEEQGVDEVASRGVVEHKGVEQETPTNKSDRAIHKEEVVGSMGMKREESDLELSSFVQKADRQFSMRTERILSKSK